jgi:hypothetical protein
VTPLANGKIVAPKRPLTVMTSHATLSPSRGVMIERFRRGYLFSLWHSSSDLMTFVAGVLLMFGVTKT